MRGTELLLTVALAATVIACGESVVVPPADGAPPLEGAVTATVLSEAAVPGATIDVRFQNTGAVRAWFNPCNRTVERLNGSTWVGLPPELRMCTAQAYELDAGSPRVERTDVPADAPTGTLRFVFPMVAEQPGAGTAQIRSTPFTVQ